MARSLDIETYLSDLETFLKANLNTYIAAINTEKGNVPVLTTINSNAYFFQTLNDTIANFDPFIFYGIVDVASEGIGPAVAKTYTLNVVIVLVDNGQDLYIGKRLLRYSRALEDLFTASWWNIHVGLKSTIKSMVPVAFKLADNSDDYRAVGLTIEVSFV